MLTQAPDDSRVREALMYALQNDTNPGVRLKALDGLSGFVRQDPQVRDAVLRALISDTNSGVRLQALRLVEPMKADSNVRSVLTRIVADGSERFDPLAGPDRCWRRCRRWIRERSSWSLSLVVGNCS